MDTDECFITYRLEYRLQAPIVGVFIIQVSNVIPAKRGKELRAFAKKEKESMRERTAVRNVASARYSAQILCSSDVRKE